MEVVAVDLAPDYALQVADYFLNTGIHERLIFFRKGLQISTIRLHG
jgi:hypothetical protein